MTETYVENAKAFDARIGRSILQKHGLNIGDEIMAGAFALSDHLGSIHHRPEKETVIQVWLERADVNRRYAISVGLKEYAAKLIETLRAKVTIDQQKEEERRRSGAGAKW